MYPVHKFKKWNLGTKYLTRIQGKVKPRGVG